MRSSFLDDPNFPFVFTGLLIGMPLIAVIIGACTQPSTPEERAEATQAYSEDIIHNSVTFTPRSGIECVVVRGYSSANPRVMSCYPVPGPVESNP